MGLENQEAFEFMSKINRWLLPEGVEEILPSQAWPIQHYQQSVLELFSSWGYDLVIPPLLEYTDSSLNGSFLYM